MADFFIYGENMNLRYFAITFGAISILLMILAIIYKAMVFGRMTPFILIMAILGSFAMFAVSFISDKPVKKEEEIDAT